MTDEISGLARFEPSVPAAMVREIESWADDAQLGKLHDSLHAHADEHTFLNAYAEAVVARHLRARGCQLRFEVPTPSGKQADFEVKLDTAHFFLHVKRVDTDQPLKTTLTVSSRLRMLERIERPYVVSIRWKEHATEAQMQRLVTDAGRFIARASVGDELMVRDEHTRREIGAVRIVAPWEGDHVTLTIGLMGFIDQAPRMRKLLSRAYKQFMPRETNVILVCTSNAEDADDFENALLGSHIERWDAFPPRGRRVAHGRDTDGFWHGKRHSQSQAAGWFQLSLQRDDLDAKLWVREGADMRPEVDDLLGELFSRVR